LAGREEAPEVPREARLDYPGALHHVMMRGVARAPIFDGDADHETFLKMLGEELKQAGASCIAWSLMPNHVHLLIRTGAGPLSRLMQRLLFRYAAWYNRRHARVGHLFQNRYKSVLCDGERYLLALVRYIHLNPLRAGLVKSLEGLSSYRWTGHPVILGKRVAGWQDTDLVLGSFANEATRARRLYASFVAEGAEIGLNEREAIGIVSLRRALQMGRDGKEHGRETRDPRILGGGDFIARAVSKVEAAERRRQRLAKRVTPQSVIEAAAKAAGVPVKSLRRPDRHAATVGGRALACKWLVEDLGMKGSAVAKLLGVTEAAVSQGVVRGRKVEEARGLSLDRVT
jgi:REP element-mobilizing transposase RayT